MPEPGAEEKTGRAIPEPEERSLIPEVEGILDLDSDHVMVDSPLEGVAQHKLHDPSMREMMAVVELHSHVAKTEGPLAAMGAAGEEALRNCLRRPRPPGCHPPCRSRPPSVSMV